eukprot:7502253-Prorocentrum_lima.AAC.1
MVAPDAWHKSRSVSVETSLGKLPCINYDMASTVLWRTHKVQNCLNCLHGPKWQDTHDWFGLTATCVLQV